ncbi:proprotein convertase P-domain-containing protein [Aequorivita lipolytica]
MMTYANADFQVRFTYDDEGSWAYAAGVDNFLLSYEISAGGGLDVFLDANGMASVDPNDLLTGVNEACGYTVTAGGAGGGTMGSLTTLFATNNGGSPNWTVMYDLTVGPNDIEVTDLDVNTDATGTFNLNLYTLVGTHVGNETNAAAWGAPASSGTGTALGTDLPSNAVLAAPVTLAANTTYGIAITMDVDVNYTNGTGCPGNQCYSNADLSLTLGKAVAGIFTGSVFSPRIWNGTINYTVGSGSGLDFTCADLGENQIEVTVTDNSGNVSTCIATVNVIDLVAPVITCGPEPTVSATISDSPALAIPDNDPAGASSTISVTEDVTIEDLDINLDATHSWVGDIIVTITSPAGTAVTIVDRIGATGGGFGCSGDDILATLDDAAASAVEDQCGAGVPSIDGTFSPNNPLTAFNGESTLGDWTITISDNAGGDTGTLNSWGITYSYANTNTDIVIELGPDGTATIDPFDIISNVVEACGIDTAAVDVTTVSCADIGTTIVITAFVSDTSGNIASCSANVIVVDRLAPVITCPADQTVDPGAGNLFYILPDYFATGEATAEDNCTDPVTITSQDPAVGTPLSDGTYTINLTATDEYGNTSTCSFELTVDTVAGLNENSLDAGLALYPNPASTVVNLVNKTNISLEKMMIYDINGKLVNQTNLRTMQGEKAVDVSSLAAGVYVVQIIGENASTVKRLIKE